MMKDDIDFRFQGAGIYADRFYNQFYLDEKGEYHSDEYPAIRYAGGGEVWMRHGKVHRDGDLPAITDAEGNQAWYKDGQFHREGQPAVIYKDGKPDEWWKNGRQLSSAEIEEIQFRQGKRDIIEKRGKEVADGMKTSHHSPIKAAKPARFSK